MPCIIWTRRGGPPMWSSAKAASCGRATTIPTSRFTATSPKESFDAYMWQTLETKAKFIAQVMTGEMTFAASKTLDAAALTYAEVKAIASGNPLVIEKAQVDAELMRLTRLRSAHAEEQYRIRTDLRHSHEDAQRFD